MRVDRWAQERVKPMAAEVDASNAFPNELWTEMGELGLLGITVPEEFGGAGSLERTRLPLFSLLNREKTGNFSRITP